LIAKNGAYVIVPNSGSAENPTALKWATIKPGKDVDPNHYLVDWEALVLRSGKTKIQICRVVRDELLEKKTEETE
jgi:tyrosyl-tRNA synthetase